MTRPLRIVVSTPTFLPIVGGAELGIHEIYRRIASEHDVTVLTPRPHPRHVSAYGTAERADAPYRVHHVPPDPESSRLGAAGRALRLTSLPYVRELRRLGRSGLDVANFHFVRPHGAALAYTRRVLGIPVLLSLVGRPDVLSVLGPVRGRYARAVVATADKVVPISSFCLGEHPARDAATIIPFGVDTSAFGPDRRSDELRRRLGVDDESLMLFTIQRLAPVKRVDLLIRTVAELLRRDPARKLVLVVGGKGEESDNLRRLAGELGVADHVRFAGFVSDDELPAYFASADAFVFHSLFETFGIVFAQAMASGTPIVAADTSCVADVVGSEHGLLVAPFDVVAFADAVDRLAGDRELRTALAERGRTRAVREFDWDAIADAYLRELHALANGNGSEKGRR